MDKKYVIWSDGGLLQRHADMVDEEAIDRVAFFVDSDEEKWNTLYFGKPVKDPRCLNAEDKNNILVLVGAFAAHSEIEFLLRKMGFEEGKNYIWAIKFAGDENIPALFKRVGWKGFSTQFYSQRDTDIRTAIAMEFVDWRKTKSMLDLGAGEMPAKRLIPAGCSYIPVDCVGSAPETVVCDFDRYEFPGYTADLVCALGVVGYIKDWRWFLDRISVAVNPGGSLIITGGIIMDEASVFSESMPYTPQVNECDVIVYLQKQGLVLSNYADWRCFSRILYFCKPEAGK